MTAHGHKPGQIRTDAEQAADALNAAGADAETPETDAQDAAPEKPRVHLHEETDEPHQVEIDLKALGNTKADINITAVLDSHGRWHWIARENTDDAKPLAQSTLNAPSEAELVENLQKLFSDGVVVALRRTGDDKARRL